MLDSNHTKTPRGSNARKLLQGNHDAVVLFGRIRGTGTHRGHANGVHCHTLAQETLCAAVIVRGRSAILCTRRLGCRRTIGIGNCSSITSLARHGLVLRPGTRIGDTRSTSGLRKGSTAARRAPGGIRPCPASARTDPKARSLPAIRTTAIV